MTSEESSANTELNTETTKYDGDSMHMNKRIERRYDILTSAAMIIALASLITAGASVYTLIDSGSRSDERTAQIIAALKEQSISVPGSAGATNQSQNQSGSSTVPSENVNSTTAAQQSGSASGQQQVGGSASAGGATGNGSASGQQQVGGSASAGGAIGNGDTQQPAAQNAQPSPEGAQAAPQNQVQPAATVPIPSPDLLLQTTMAAAEPGVPGSQLATKAVDGQAAAATLERVAEVRAKMAPPPGMEHMGDVVNFQIHNVVVNNDTATATLVIVWPAGWGEWTYPDSGYQYVDGEWKLQKSTVCNLAAAAWVDCY